MTINPLFLSATYYAGDKFGAVLAYVFILLMAIELVYVFVKYVLTSNK